ncbi:MAG TPA: hypothetical protein VFS43_35935 [Polyangiaceae bacterium]|nr:hypothetical protein [Polyangiaceae bacterium]
MSGSRARFLLSFGAFVALLGASSAGRAERPRAFRGSSLLQLTAAREALAPGSSRNWGLSYPVADETYAGPWAYSPLAPVPPHVPARAFVTPFERNGERNPAAAPGAPDPNAQARQTESMLSRLGPVGMLASVLIPAVMASSSHSGAAGSSGRVARNDVSARLGFAKLGRGYGIVLTGRFY